MLKKSKSKLKSSKKVHFDENQIIDKRTLSNSFEKNKKNEKFEFIRINKYVKWNGIFISSSIISFFRK